MKNILYGVLVILIPVLLTTAEGGTVIVNNDEWTLSNTGFANAPGDTEQFVTNVATLFSNGGAGSFHAYSTNFSYTGSSLSTTLDGAGHTYTTGTGFAFTTANISGFDALFLGGTFLSSTEITTLIDYVNTGGKVYLAGGAVGGGGATAEAAAWNPFLNAFGMSFTSPYNGLIGNIDVTGATHPIFDGVSELYQNSGNSIVGSGIEVSLNGQGLYAVSAIPLPASFPLLATGIAGLGLLTRRKLKAV